MRWASKPTTESSGEGTVVTREGHPTRNRLASLLRIHDAGSDRWIVERWFPKMVAGAADLQASLDADRAAMTEYADAVSIRFVGYRGRFPNDQPARIESSLARAERKRGISVPSVPCPMLIVDSREFLEERGTAVARVYGFEEPCFLDLDHWGLILHARVPQAMAWSLTRVQLCEVAPV